MFAADEPTRPAAKDPFLEDLPTVEAASLHTQTLKDAPANVTLVTRADIRKFGYRTLGEALSGVRGFYLSNDHIYNYAGVRGFSLPGDFNTRFLVMINGHPMTDGVYSANGYFGQDFGLDLDLVDRIEVIRGPSSALYGSNGIFATINIITISPVDFPHAYASMEAGDFGSAKLLGAASFYLGHGANLLVAGSRYYSAGRSFRFPELDQPGAPPARAVGMDWEQAYHTFANLTWRNWNFIGYFNNRDKGAPLGWDFDANTFTRGNHADDARNFVSATYRRSAGIGDLRVMLAYDQSRYHDRFDHWPEEGESIRDLRTYGKSDQMSVRVSYQFPAKSLGTLTAGADTTLDFRTIQFDREEAPQPHELFRVSRPQRNAALFLQQEKRLSVRWKLDLGARLDASRNYGAFVSPRLALEYQPSEKTAVKFIYGRPFRHPNSYEQDYYNASSFLRAELLKPETAHTYEVSIEHQFSPRISGSLNFFDYRLRNLIETVFLHGGYYQFRNAGAVRSRGVEIELGGKPRAWLEVNASITAQYAHHNEEQIALPNSPSYLAKARWSIPMGSRVALSNSNQWISARRAYDLEAIPARPAVLTDVTLTVERAIGGADLQFGVRNGLNWAYDDPIGLSQQYLRASPRTAYVKLLWNMGK